MYEKNVLVAEIFLGLSSFEYEKHVNTLKRDVRSFVKSPILSYLHHFEQENCVYFVCVNGVF